jgi:uncharacterized protein YeaO (DUF488 family)
MEIILKRAYLDASDTDGARVLVERLWPRGVSKERARIDLWLKEAAPSTDLRRWFGHDPDRWDAFRRRYYAELQTRPEALTELAPLLERGPVTFIYGSREERFNAAVALRDYLLDQVIVRKHR